MLVAALLGMMIEGVINSDIQFPDYKKLDAQMDKLAVLGQSNQTCRREFIRRLEQRASEGWLGLLTVKCDCWRAEELGASWIRENEITLKYRTLDHVALLMGNTFSARTGIATDWD